MDRTEPHEPTTASSDEAVVSAAPEEDVLAVVERQHQEIRERFATLTDGRPHDAAAELGELRRLLAVHEAAEEEVIYPYLRSIDGGDTVADEREHEEELAKEVLADLADLEVDTPDFAGTLAALQTMVLAHADAEERTVLPRLRQAAAAGDLERMADRFLAAGAAAHPAAT